MLKLLSIQICFFQRVFLILGNALGYRDVSKGYVNSLEHNSMSVSEFVSCAGTGNGRVLCHISSNLGCIQDILLQADATLLSSLNY